MFFGEYVTERMNVKLALCARKGFRLSSPRQILTLAFTCPVRFHFLPLPRFPSLNYDNW